MECSFFQMFGSVLGPIDDGSGTIWVCHVVWGLYAAATNDGLRFGSNRIEQDQTRTPEAMANRTFEVDGPRQCVKGSRCRKSGIADHPLCATLGDGKYSASSV